LEEIMSQSGWNVHMPVLAFMAMMMDQGMPVSEAVQTTIDSIPGGDLLDEEIARAATWLHDQGKSMLVSRMMRHLCACQEVMESDTHWARLVAVPVVGASHQVARFAEHWPQAQLGNLQNNPRVPADAQWFWLPFAFDPQEVDGWRTCQRSWVLQTILDGLDRPERLQESLALLGKGLTPAPASAEGFCVRMLVGVLVSRDRVWLDGGDADPLLHLGVDIEGLTDDIIRELREQGVPSDDDAVRNHFAGVHGLDLDELTEQVAQAQENELTLLRQQAATLQVPGVDLQTLFPLTDAVARCTWLALNLALDLDRAGHPTEPEGFTQAHLSQPSDTDPTWVVGVTEQGAAWGPYPLRGVSLWLDQIPDLAQDVFGLRCADPDTADVEVIFHAYPCDLPQPVRATH
jgi:hypothetical protein